MGSATATALPTALTWVDEEARHTVQLEFGNVLLWRHAVSSGGRAGLLFGNARRGGSGRLTAYIQSSETLVDKDLSVNEALHQTSLAAASREQSEVAGIWISDPDDSVSADSLTLPELRDGMLLLALQSSSARLHFWDARARKFHDLGLTFPVKPRDLTLADYKPFRPMFLGRSAAETSEADTSAKAMPVVAGGSSLTAATAAAPALDSQISEQPVNKKNRFTLTRTTSAVAAGAAATATVIIATALFWPGSKSAAQPTLPSQPVSAQQIVTPPPASELGLELNRAGQDVQLRWNRNLPVLASARGGSVAITDGTDHLILALNRDQLTTGRVIYTPRSRDVDFELTIQSSDGKNLTESVRAVQPPPKPATPLAPAEKGAPAETRQTADTVVRTRTADPPATAASSAAGSITPSPAPQATTTKSVQLPSVQLAEDPPPVISSGTMPAPQALTNLPTAAPAFRTANPTPTPVSPSLTTPVKLPPQLWSTLRKEIDVQLTLVVGPNGRVQSIKKPLEDDPLRRAVISIAANTVLGWHFNPAKVNGTPVKGEYVVNFRFKPNGSPASSTQ